MKYVIRHVKDWNKWRKNNLNSWWFKFLILIGLISSPTFEVYKWNEKLTR